MKNKDTRAQKRALIEELLASYNIKTRVAVKEETNGTINDLQEQVDSLQHENTILANEVERLHGDKDIIEEKLHLLTGDYDRLDEQHKELTEQCAKLKKKVHQLKEHEKELQETSSSQNDEIAQEQLRFQTLMTHISDENKIYKEKLDLFDNKIKSVSTLLTEKNQTINDLQHKITTCIEKELELQTQLSSQHDLDQHPSENALKDLESENKRLKKRYNSLEKRYSELKATASSTDQISASSSQMIDGTPDELREENSTLHLTITELHEKLKDLESECTLKDDEIRKLTEETNILMRERESVHGT